MTSANELRALTAHDRDALILAMRAIHSTADNLVGDARCSERPGCILAKGHSIRGILQLAEEVLRDVGVNVESYHTNRSERP